MIAEVNFSGQRFSQNHYLIQGCLDCFQFYILFCFAQERSYWLKHRNLDYLIFSVSHQLESVS